jgi:hypothetical protein
MNDCSVVSFIALLTSLCCVLSKASFQFCCRTLLTLLYYTLLYYTLLYRALLYCTSLYYTLIYYTLISIP